MKRLRPESNEQGGMTVSLAPNFFLTTCLVNGSRHQFVGQWKMISINYKLKTTSIVLSIEDDPNCSSMEDDLNCFINGR
jgi:hypothetical protein